MEYEEKPVSSNSFKNKTKKKKSTKKTQKIKIEEQQPTNDDGSNLLLQNIHYINNNDTGGNLLLRELDLGGTSSSEFTTPVNDQNFKRLSQEISLLPLENDTPTSFGPKECLSFSDHMNIQNNKKKSSVSSISTKPSSFHFTNRDPSMNMNSLNTSNQDYFNSLGTLSISNTNTSLTELKLLSDLKQTELPLHHDEKMKHIQSVFEYDQKHACHLKNNTSCLFSDQSIVIFSSHSY